MSFEWKVQPYQFIGDAQRAYTSAIMLTSRKAGYEIAREAKAWMQDNAPWTDRDIVRKIRDGKGNIVGERILYPAGTARRSLHVSRMKDPKTKQYEADMAAARNEDALLLDEVRQWIRINKKKAISEANKMGGAAGARRKAEINKMRRFQPKLYKNESKVEALKKQQAGYKSPLVSLRFHYYKGPPYAIWLEIGMQGRYGIISRAIDYWSPKLMAKIRSLSNLKQYEGMFTFGEIEEPEEQFASFLSSRAEGGFSTKTWSEQLKQTRTKRRPEYNYEEVKQYREELQEYSRRSGLRGEYKEKTAPTMRIDVINRRY